MTDQKITKDQVDIPVKLFIRITRKSNEAMERAILIARDEKGREFDFIYKDFDGYPQDLIVEDR